MSLSPQVLWAQRSNATEAEKNFIYLTIKLADAENVKIDLTATELHFQATANNKPYELKLEFFKAIDETKSKYDISGSGIFFKLFKAEMQEEYWPRLIKEKLRLHYLKTDFDKWADEDEQDAVEEVEEPMGGPGGPGGPGAGGMPDFGSMMGGAGGAGGMPDFASMMGGAGGAGGPGGMDFASMMSQMGGMGGEEGGAPGFDMSKLAELQKQFGQEGEAEDEAEEAEAIEEVA